MRLAWLSIVLMFFISLINPVYAQLTKDVSVEGDLSVIGTVTAETFFGNGSGLTNTGAKEIYQPASRGIHQTDGSNNYASSFTEYDITDRELWNVVTGEAAAQDLDIVYQMVVPENFGSWDGASALSVHYKVPSATNVTVYIYGTDGGLIDNKSGTSVSETEITFSDTDLSGGTFTVGQNFIVLCKANVDTGELAYIGWVKGKYK